MTEPTLTPEAIATLKAAREYGRFWQEWLDAPETKVAVASRRLSGVVVALADRAKDYALASLTKDPDL